MVPRVVQQRQLQRTHAYVQQELPLAQPNPAALLPARSVAEFFAGIGLVRAGLERTGWTVTFANDNDPQKVVMYTGHFHDQHTHVSAEDVNTLSSEAVPTVSLATASFPCTDFSLAGSREGINGPESSAFWGFVHVLTDMGARRPPLVMLENVTGFRTSNNGDDFVLAMQTLNGLGYSVDAFEIDAVRFVPQSRRRMFVVATLDALYGPTESVILPDPLESDARPKALATFIRAHLHDIRWRIRPLPPLPPSGMRRIEAVLEDLPPNHPAWWSVPRKQHLLNQMSARHRALADAMIGGDRWTYGTVFRRMRVNPETHQKQSTAELRTDGIAGCLRTPKGGSAKQILFKAGYGEYHVRLITPTEAARLMGMDDYTLPDSLDQALFGFGDAVCVPVVEWVATHYLNPVVDERLGWHALASVRQQPQQENVE